jgi:hypothetical protein
MTNVTFLKSLIGSKIFSVNYTKVNGEISKMTARFSVTKGVTGKGLKYDATARNNASVFNMHKKAFRTLKVDNIVSIKFNGVSLTKKELDALFITTMAERFYSEYKDEINYDLHNQVA